LPFPFDVRPDVVVTESSKASSSISLFKYAVLQHSEVSWTTLECWQLDSSPLCSGEMKALSKGNGEVFFEFFWIMAFIGGQPMTHLYAKTISFFFDFL
jgi:hypothetical protein